MWKTEDVILGTPNEHFVIESGNTDINRDLRTILQIFWIEIISMIRVSNIAQSNSPFSLVFFFPFLLLLFPSLPLCLLFSLLIPHILFSWSCCVAQFSLERSPVAQVGLEHVIRLLLSLDSFSVLKGQSLMLCSVINIAYCTKPVIRIQSSAKDFETNLDINQEQMHELSTRIDIINYCTRPDCTTNALCFYFHWFFYPGSFLVGGIMYLGFHADSEVRLTWVYLQLATSQKISVNFMDENFNFPGTWATWIYAKGSLCNTFLLISPSFLVEGVISSALWKALIKWCTEINQSILSPHISWEWMNKQRL